MSNINHNNRSQQLGRVLKYNSENLKAERLFNSSFSELLTDSKFILPSDKNLIRYSYFRQMSTEIYNLAVQNYSTLLIGNPKTFEQAFRLLDDVEQQKKLQEAAKNIISLPINNLQTYYQAITFSTQVSFRDLIATLDANNLKLCGVPALIAVAESLLTYNEYWKRYELKDAQQQLKESGLVIGQAGRAIIAAGDAERINSSSYLLGFHVGAYGPSFFESECKANGQGWVAGTNFLVQQKHDNRQVFPKDNLLVGSSFA